MEKFQLEDNKCYSTVMSNRQEQPKLPKTITQENKGINKCKLLLILIFVFVLLLGLAGACIAFTLELSKLKNEIQTFQQLNTSINMLYQTLDQENCFITADELNSLNSSIDMLHQQLNQQNGFIRAHELNSSIDMLYQQLLNQQNGFVTAHELNSSIDMLHQQLNLKNESIQFAYQLNTSLTLELSSSISQLDEVITNRLETIVNDLLLGLYTPQPQCGDGFWKQVANINMNDSSHQCPSAWEEYRQSASPPRYCAIPRGGLAGCVQTSFPVNSQYNKVCGRVTGRSVHSTDSFDGRGHRTDVNYIDGVSITHSSDRSHIWSFAAGHRSFYHCPCGSTNPVNPPSFVGENYFCDDAVNGAVWDGEGCVAGEECCLFNTPPWFTVQLLEVAMDDIDVRICIDEFVGNENVGIELLELYVQI